MRRKTRAASPWRTASITWAADLSCAAAGGRTCAPPRYQRAKGAKIR